MKGDVMRLLIQLLLLSTINLLLRGIVWFIRVLLPVFRLSFRILSVPVGMSFTAMAIGPSEYITTIAHEWTDWLINRGANPRNRRQINSLCRFLVTTVLILGWVFISLFIIGIVRVYFGLFT